jgi:hypothetical protein
MPFAGFDPINAAVQHVPNTPPSPGQMDRSGDDDNVSDATPFVAERLRAEQEALTIAMHEGPVQNFTMLGIRLEQARARLARGEIAETERALSQLQLALAREISALRRMLTARRPEAS